MLKRSTYTQQFMVSGKSRDVYESEIEITDPESKIKGP